MPSTLTVYAARAVSCWVTRYRYGVRDEQGQVPPYDSMEEEQNGLELVFKGVRVKRVVQPPHLNLDSPVGDNYGAFTMRI